MAWIVSFIILGSCIWTKSVDMLYASGLFAIAGSIEILATKFHKK